MLFNETKAAMEASFLCDAQMDTNDRFNLNLSHSIFQYTASDLEI